MGLKIMEPWRRGIRTGNVAKVVPWEDLEDLILEPGIFDKRTDRWLKPYRWLKLGSTEYLEFMVREACRFADIEEIEETKHVVEVDRRSRRKTKLF